MPYVQGMKWKSYWLIEMKIRETLQAVAFSFIVLGLVEKAALDFVLIMPDYIMNALRKKQLITSNAEHLKKIMETLKTSVFGFIMVNLVKYFTLFHYRRVIRGRKRAASLVISRKLKKIYLTLAKSALIVTIYGLNFSFKMHFLKFF